MWTRKQKEAQANQKSRQSNKYSSQESGRSHADERSVSCSIGLSQAEQSRLSRQGQRTLTTHNPGNTLNLNFKKSRSNIIGAEEGQISEIPHSDIENKSPGLKLSGHAAIRNQQNAQSENSQNYSDAMILESTQTPEEIALRNFPIQFKGPLPAELMKFIMKSPSNPSRGSNPSDFRDSLQFHEVRSNLTSETNQEDLDAFVNMMRTNRYQRISNGMSQFNQIQAQRQHLIRGVTASQRTSQYEQYLVSKTFAGRGEHDACSICQANFEYNEEVCYLSCNHIFHRECIVGWLELSKKCPNCRQEVRKQNQLQNQRLVAPNRPNHAQQPQNLNRSTIASNEYGQRGQQANPTEQNSYWY